MDTTNRSKLNLMKRCLIMTACVLLAIFLPMESVYAVDNSEELSVVDPINNEDSYSAVLYNNTNGLPTSEANDIDQTSEGFIWIGSYSGLIRYDGNTFERVDSTTGIVSVVSLMVDSRDRLWIGTNDNGLAMMENGEYTFWGEDDGLGSSKICDIAEGDDGTVYVGTTDGISMISPDLELRNFKDPELSNIYVETMTKGNDGLIYVISNEDDYMVLEGSELKEYIDHNETDIRGITAILPDPDEPGKIYLSTGGTELYHGDMKHDLSEMEYIDLNPLFGIIDIEKYGDTLWVCGNNGIGAVDKNGFHLIDNLPMDNSVTHIITDYEGNLWFTSSRQGVMKLVKSRFISINERYSLSDTVVNSTCIYGDKLLVATDTGILVLDEEKGSVGNMPVTSAMTASGEPLNTTNLVEYLDGCRIRSIIKDSKDRIWISTWRGKGLLRYDKGELVAFTEKEGMFSDHVRAVAETDDGKILVAHTGGVAVIEGNEITATYGEAEGIDNLEILTVVSAPNGDILAGSNGDGIYVINDKGLSKISRKEGLSSGIVMRIKRDDEHGVYWLVTSNSIAYMDQDYNITTLKDFPYSNNFDMYENSKGDMWILSSDGIYVLSVDELLENKEFKPVHYGLANGLPCTTTSNSYSVLTAKGDLYIAGNTGVVKVNINGSMEEVGKLKQAVPYIDVDGVIYYPDNKGRFHIPASALKVTVYAFIYNYSLTDPKVTYSLEGFDREPVTVYRSELDPVTYTNLKGGEYTFVMDLTDAMGRGSQTLSVPIIKEKALYENKVFYLVVGIAFILGMSLFVRNYIKWMVADIEKKHKEEEERQRIGNELSMATKIQTALLPHDFPPFPDRKEFDIYASMNPAREVGGDFYDFFMVDDDHLCMVIADVSGKGVPAAMFMTITKTIMKTYAKLGQSASEVFYRANEAICANNRMDMFVTVWLGILEISTGKLTAANAGHEYPVIKRAGGTYDLFKDKHGLVIGGMEGMKYKEYEIQLAPGDAIFLYTDGVPEATDKNNKMFGLERMIRALNEDPEASPEQVLHNVREAVDDFVKNAEQFDDLTMLSLDYKGPVKP